MSLTENGNGMVMPVSPLYNGGGFGGFGGFGDASWLIIILLFAMFGNGGWGMGGGNVGGMIYPWMNQAQATQAGFDQAATAASLAGIQTSLTNGFSNSEVAECNRAMNAMQTAYTNQIASMNADFAAQTALSNQLTQIASNQAACCCENRLGLANLGADIAREACADRTAVTDALRDVLTAGAQNTQRIIDQMCQDKIDAKNEKIVDLQNQLNMATLRESQNAQTAALLANNEAQTAALEQYLAPIPRPAYVVQNPACCNPVAYGCGVA